MLRTGKAIQIVRRAKGLRASDVAKRAGISNPFLSLIEQGEREPSLDVLQRLANALGVPVEALILMSKPDGSSLRSTDQAANGLAKAVKRLTEAEAVLREKLETEFCPDAST